MPVHGRMHGERAMLESAGAHRSHDDSL